MKSPKEIKEATRLCGLIDTEHCIKKCPYRKDFEGLCVKLLSEDTLEYIEQLEERIAIMTESEGWIPTAERMPEESGTYLAVVMEDRINGNDSQTIVSIRDYMKSYGMFNTLIDDTITHWMPLPKPPKGETENV